MTWVYASVIGLTLVIVLLALLVVGLLKTQAEILRRLDQLGVRLDPDDASAPVSISAPAERKRSPILDLTGVSPTGEPMALSLRTGDDPVLLAFLSTTCTSCTEFWEAMDSDSMMFHEARYRVVAITLGPDEESPTRALKLAKPGTVAMMSSQVWNTFEVPGAPYFVVVDPQESAVIGEGSATTMDSLVTFLNDAAGDRRWDRSRGKRPIDRTDADRERLIDDELHRSGIYPGDPRLHHGQEPDGH